MLYKGGGKNPEDRKSYRPLSMINHARKLMAMILLMNLQEETGAFIPESYNGFRAGRSTDDTLTALVDFRGFLGAANPSGAVPEGVSPTHRKPPRKIPKLPLLVGGVI